MIAYFNVSLNYLCIKIASNFQKGIFPQMTKIPAILLLAIILFPGKALPKEFSPWYSDVKVGDQLIASRPKKKLLKKYDTINGVQGGGFFMIRFFQYFISPQDGPNCRHVPVCSVYAIHAIGEYGALWGSLLTGDRLLRCNTFYPPERRDIPGKLFGK